jgi:hypothetical protein
MEDGTNIKLCDFNDATRYFVLNTSSLSVEIVSGTRDSYPKQDLSGWGEFKSIGLLRTRQIFIGIYASKSTLHVVLDGTDYEINRPDVEVSLHSVFLALKKFRLSAVSIGSREYSYWHFSGDSWPDSGDLFKKIEEIINSTSMRGQLFSESWEWRK